MNNLMDLQSVKRQQRARLLSFEISHPRQINRSVSVLALTGLFFQAVCGGPFGIEEAVGAAGPLLVLILTVVLPIVYGLPCALLTAEMSTMIDKNGGHVIWVKQGLGQFAMFISSFNNLVCNFCDLALYATMFGDNVAQFLAMQFGFDPDENWKFTFKLCAILIVGISNLIGLDFVSKFAASICVITILPFCIQPFFSWADLDLGNSLEVPSISKIEWPLFLGTLIWNYQGWVAIGCVAGEVKDGKRAFPLATLFTLMLAVLAYSVPIIVGMSFEPDYTKWTDGCLQVIAGRISKVMGVMVLSAACLSIMGQFMVMMGSSSRAVQTMALFHVLPEWLTNQRANSVPHFAVLLEMSVTAILIFFPFKFLIVVDTFFGNVALVLQIISFVRLKFVKPNADRPFAAPGGKVGGILLAVPVLSFVFFLMATSGTQCLIVCSIFNAIIFVAYYFMFGRHPPPEQDYEEISEVLEVGSVGSGSGSGSIELECEKSESYQNSPTGSPPLLSLSPSMAIRTDSKFSNYNV